MMVMRVVQKPWTYPCHYKRLLAFTTFPAWNMLPLTQFSPHLAVHHKHHPDQCTAAYLLVSADNCIPDSTQACSDSSDEEDDFQMYPWMMNTGLLKKHLTELYVSMNMDYHMDYASTHVLMQTITLFHTWTVWI